MLCRSLVMLPFFLIAALPACVAENAHYDRANDTHGFTVFLNDGGWCWFQDPRALLIGDGVIVGGVAGNGDIVAGFF